MFCKGRKVWTKSSWVTVNVIIVEDDMTSCYTLASWKVEMLLWRCHLYFFVTKEFVTILTVPHCFPSSALVLSTIAKFVTLLTTANREIMLTEMCTWFVICDHLHFLRVKSPINTVAIFKIKYTLLKIFKVKKHQHTLQYTLN